MDRNASSSYRFDRRASVRKTVMHFNRIGRSDERNSSPRIILAHIQGMENVFFNTSSFIQ
jgi:hypothetical protein